MIPSRGQFVDSTPTTVAIIVTSTQNIKQSVRHAKGVLGEAVDASIASGELNEVVSAEIAAIAGIPISEEAGEAPHAIMHNEFLRAPAADRPWKSASVRLASNIAMWEKMAVQYTAALSREWVKWKRVVQVKPVRSKYPCKNKRSEVFQSVYRTSGGVGAYSGPRMKHISVREPVEKASSEWQRRVDFLKQSLETNNTTRSALLPTYRF